MDKIYKNLKAAIEHLEAIDYSFNYHGNFKRIDKKVYEIYKQNLKLLDKTLTELIFYNELYHEKGRQMILADMIEYIFLGRGYYSIKNKDDKSKFIKAILRFVNILMSYEEITVNAKLRKAYLLTLANKIPRIKDEKNYYELLNFEKNVGLKKGESDASEEIDDYFDTLLPKTAGGLWHELLVYIFLLRSNIGYIIPLLLTQRILSLENNIVPPDFLIITEDKHIYGIEVGTKKEIQSGAFSLQTAIPTATIDTINSRSSDRCPICKKWILFCDYIIERFSDLNYKIEKNEIRCLQECQLYNSDEISKGKCPYAKYSRQKAKTLIYTQHQYANGLHYHYNCVLQNLPIKEKNILIDSKDSIAIKTHFPYYSGLEALLKRS